MADVNKEAEAPTSRTQRGLMVGLAFGGGMGVGCAVVVALLLLVLATTPLGPLLVIAAFWVLLSISTTEGPQNDALQWWLEVAETAYYASAAVAVAVAAWLLFRASCRLTRSRRRYRPRPATDIVPPGDALETGADNESLP